ncbi:phage regulatory protein, Rha family [Campylobacter porcelli]|uniref:Phage regulatory protein, Rha family n=2 Tax=Campylobacteraceae TaxID=72294 RepID=A0A1X9SVU1_9BACT|nr:phage regulatory protein, Rha family [Campylobacter sp. RM6137]
MAVLVSVAVVNKAFSAGFSLLVMGFTGEKAYRWKIEFIKAFNKMEAMLKVACGKLYHMSFSHIRALDNALKNSI